MGDSSSEELSFAFSQSEHIKDARLFSSVMRSPHKCHFSSGRIMGLLAREEDAPYAQLGFAIGKKVGRAPRRNRWKRLWKEAFRLERPHFAQPVNMVVWIKPKAGLMELGDLRLVVRDMAQKVELSLAP